MNNKWRLTELFEKYPKTINTIIWLLIVFCYSITFREHSSSSGIPVPSFDFRYIFWINSVIALVCTFIMISFIGSNSINKVKYKTGIILLCLFWILLFPLYNKTGYESIYWQYWNYTMSENNNINELWSSILPDIWRGFLSTPKLEDSPEWICKYINLVTIESKLEPWKNKPSDYVTGIKVALNQWNIDEVEKCTNNKEYFNIAKEYLTTNNFDNYKLIAKFHYLYEHKWNLEDYYNDWIWTRYDKFIYVENNYIKSLSF